jgi:hypothetical protein
MFPAQLRANGKLTRGREPFSTRKSENGYVYSVHIMEHPKLTALPLGAKIARRFTWVIMRERVRVVKVRAHLRARHVGQRKEKKELSDE